MLSFAINYWKILVILCMGGFLSSCGDTTPIKSVDDVLQYGNNKQTVTLSGKITEKLEEGIIRFEDHTGSIIAQLNTSDKTITKIHIGDYIKIEAKIYKALGQEKTLIIKRIWKIDAAM